MVLQFNTLEEPPVDNEPSVFVIDTVSEEGDKPIETIVSEAAEIIQSVLR
jgi:hypothetical protein